MFKVSEIFSSLQGEGSLIGMPSSFLRLSGCNLRCTWCDTPYASWEATGDNLSLEEIVSQIKAYNNKYLVITGGEPMIFKELPKICKAFKDEKHITIETAGTLYQDLDCDLMSISPKLKNSTPVTRENGKHAEKHEALRLQPGVLKKLIKNYTYQLKFVVSEEGDLEEIKSLLAELGSIPPENVFLMPEGITVEALQEKSEWISAVCVENGFRYSPRLHIELYGNTPGT